MTCVGSYQLQPSFCCVGKYFEWCSMTITLFWCCTAMNFTIYFNWIFKERFTWRCNIRNICNGEKVVLTFVHRSTQCTGSQGPLGLGYGPLIAMLWLLRAGKVTVMGLLPMAVTWDVMSYASYRISGRWRIWWYVTIYVMYRWYKSGCNPVPGSPFASPVAGDLSTP